MEKEKGSSQESKWFSTYGTLTAQRILERFSIHLDRDELPVAITNRRSIYYLLLRAPLKNVYNGIILQQAHDYQVYVQKLFIDYLISGQNDLSEESPGVDSRDKLTEYSEQIIQLGEEFAQLELSHHQLIAESQHHFIKLGRSLQESLVNASKELKKILTRQGENLTANGIMVALRKAIVAYSGQENDMFADSSLFWGYFENHLNSKIDARFKEEMRVILVDFITIHTSVDEMLSKFYSQSEHLAESLRSFRMQFKQAIVTTNELIQNLPEYKPEEANKSRNQESIMFDPEVGNPK